MKALGKVQRLPCICILGGKKTCPAGAMKTCPAGAMKTCPTGAIEAELTFLHLSVERVAKKGLVRIQWVRQKRELHRPKDRKALLRECA